MSIETEKRSRAGIRGSFTRIIDKIKVTLDDAERSDSNIIELRALSDILREKHNQICIKDASIYDLMVANASVNETDLDEELYKVDEYALQYSLIEKRVDNLVHKDQMSTCESVHSQSANSSKLPKMKLKQFNGELKDWLPFWDQFKKIHTDNKLDSNDKMHYLLMCISPNTAARELVDSFPATGDMYQEVVKSLKGRYGRDDLLTEYYIRELLKIILSSATSNVKLPLSVLYDKVQSHLRNLNGLGVTTENCAPILLPLVSSCLPTEILKTWERKGTGNSGATSKEILEGLLQFLKGEVEGEQKISMAASGFGLTPISTKNDRGISGVRKNDNYNRVPTAAALLTTNQGSNEASIKRNFKGNVCLFCSLNHKSQDCRKAQDLSVQERRKIVEEKRACFCCLRLGHGAKACQNRPKCLICKKPHFPLVCEDLESADKKVVMKKSNVNIESSNSKNMHTSVSEVLASFINPSKIILQTLMVKIICEDRTREVRALIDTASQRTYVLGSTVESMGYQPKRNEDLRHSLFGGVQTSEQSYSVYQIYLSSLDDKYQCNFEALNQSKICGSILPVEHGPWVNELAQDKIILTDINCVTPIEILIGADIAGKLLTGGVKALKCGPVAVETKLGWTLMGKSQANLCSDSEDSKDVMSMLTVDVKISDLWSLDSLGIRDPTEKVSSAELEAATYQHFLNTVEVNKENRLEVRLPFLDNHPPLPSNFQLALKRLKNLIKKLKVDGYYDAYQELLNDWAAEKIIEQIDEVGKNDSQCHYLPHRHVIKSGSSTPIRPVFDASANERNMPSLNQCLQKGPNLIELIPAILARFRMKKYGILADIRRAFLQLSISPKDRDYLRFLWEDSEGNLIYYRHCRVVFGVSPSPFQLAASIEFHLNNVEREIKNGNRKLSLELTRQLKNSFYVDNAVTSLDSEEDCQEFMILASQIMSERGFDLRAWEMNTTEQMPPSNVLGLLWDKRVDTLELNLKNMTSLGVEVVTKRVILSAAHRIFDPNGILSCITLVPKMLLQRLSEDGVKNWDQEVNSDIKENFLAWLKDVPLLTEIKISRWLGMLPGDVCTLHIFSDSSKVAYATVAFLRIESVDGIKLSFIASKSRVAPIKPKRMTIPRLELLGASISARLHKSIEEDYGFSYMRTIFWTDATTVLAWIYRKEPWNVFVDNRVKEIRALTAGHIWRHVPGVMNPADLPSRSCSPKKLLKSHWWEGPSWLLKPEETWPEHEVNYNEEEINNEKGKRVVSSLFSGLTSPEWYYSYFSNYKKIVRMLGWMLRFVNNLRLKRNDVNQRSIGELTAEEYKAAEIKLFLLVQFEAFEENDNRLKTLMPKVDEKGIIRLVTKVTNRTDTHDFCHPIILPNQTHPVVFRLIMDVHKDNGHAGTQILLSILRKRFWVMGGRKTVRSVLNKCVVCKRYAAKRLEAVPTPLPEPRVREANIFEISGVDLAGPLYIKTDGGEMKRAYVVLFTCAVYRAIHLELITSLSTDSFIQALRRFVSRRGRTCIMYSDQGSNFIGLENACKDLDWAVIQQYSSVQKIEWRFNPPSAPWWGGWFERLIGILKRLLRRILGKTSVTYEEMTTILCDCEAVINHRPLTFMSQNTSDLTPITPSMFLQEVDEVGVPDLDAIESTHLNKRLRYRQHLKTVLRERFRTEYLGQLQLFSNKRNCNEPTVGEIVLVGSDDKRRIDWPIGRVIETIAGTDGHIRTVKIKTANGELIRPIQRIFPLEVHVDLSVNKVTGDHLRKTMQFKNIETVSDISVENYNEENDVVTKRGRIIKKPKRYL